MWKSGEGPQMARTFYPHGVCEETQVIHSRFRPAVNSPVLHKIFLHNPHPLWIFLVTLWAGSHTQVPLPTRYRFCGENRKIFLAVIISERNVEWHTPFVGAMKIARNVAVSDRHVEWHPPLPGSLSEGAGTPNGRD